MTLEQLRIFAAVAERGDFARAAEALGITESSASAAITELEERYHTKLLERFDSAIQLTEPGRLFLREARAILERVAVARSLLEDFSGRATGTVNVAASQTIATYWLPRRLADFHAANRHVLLNVEIGNTHEVATAVVDGRAHIGLVEGPTPHPALIRQRLDQDQLVLVVASSQPPLPVNASGRLDLRAVTWVIREAGSGTRRGLEDLAFREGLSLDDLDIALVLPSNEAVREAIEAGAGATVISRYVVAAAIEAGRLTEIPVELPPREYALIHHSERRPTLAQQAVMSHLIPIPATYAF